MFIVSLTSVHSVQKQIIIKTYAVHWVQKSCSVDLSKSKYKKNINVLVWINLFGSLYLFSTEMGNITGDATFVYG